MSKEPNNTDAVLGGDSPPQPREVTPRVTASGSSVRAKLRIEGASKADLDAIVSALRTVLEVEEQSRDYANRGNLGFRRYLDVQLKKP